RQFSVHSQSAESRGSAFWSATGCSRFGWEHSKSLYFHSRSCRIVIEQLHQLRQPGNGALSSQSARSGGKKVVGGAKSAFNTAICRRIGISGWVGICRRNRSCPGNY